MPATYTYVYTSVIVVAVCWLNAVKSSVGLANISSSARSFSIVIIDWSSYGNRHHNRKNHQTNSSVTAITTTTTTTIAATKYKQRKKVAMAAEQNVLLITNKQMCAAAAATTTTTRTHIYARAGAVKHLSTQHNML